MIFYFTHLSVCMTVLMDYLQCMCTCTQMKCGRDARMSLYYVWNSVRACVCVWFCVCDSHTPHSHPQSQTCTVECVSACVCVGVSCVCNLCLAPVLLCANINAPQVQGCGLRLHLPGRRNALRSSQFPLQRRVSCGPHAAPQRTAESSNTYRERELVAQCICNLCPANSNRSTVVI